ncbi:hypothetical protein J6590_039866 [Homalodisca vitripennis]|nr:hypothetical protein J6590_039866 [Homalodisca vitripennis]
MPLKDNGLKEDVYNRVIAGSNTGEVKEMNGSRGPHCFRELVLVRSELGSRYMVFVEYGHVVKLCGRQEPSCAFCAGEYEFKECPKKERHENAACINCKRESRVDDRHGAGCRDCPVYELRRMKLHGGASEVGLIQRSSLYFRNKIPDEQLIRNRSVREDILECRIGVGRTM